MVEIMVTLTILAVLASVGPTLLTNMGRYWRVSMARANVQRSARNSLDMVNRNLRQATASSITITQRTSQPPYSWIQFRIDKGTGAAVGHYAFYQEGRYLYFMKNGATSTLADNLKYMAYTYPRTDTSGIVSVSMTFEEATFGNYRKALQLSIEKVRVMN